MVDGVWEQVGEVGAGDSLLVNGLRANTSYEFRVCSINRAGVTYSTAQSVEDSGAGASLGRFPWLVGQVTRL